MSTDREAAEAAYYGNGRTDQARRNVEAWMESGHMKKKRAKASDIVGAVVAGIVIVALLAVVVGLLVWAAVIIWGEFL